MTRLILVSNGDDWEALYLDGKSVCQDHTINRDILADYILDTKEKPVYLQGDPQQSYDLGRFPDKLEDVELVG